MVASRGQQCLILRQAVRRLDRDGVLDRGRFEFRDQIRRLKGTPKRLEGGPHTGAPPSRTFDRFRSPKSADGHRQQDSPDGSEERAVSVDGDQMGLARLPYWRIASKERCDQDLRNHEYALWRDEVVDSLSVVAAAALEAILARRGLSQLYRAAPSHRQRPGQVGRAGRLVGSKLKYSCRLAF